MCAARRDPTPTGPPGSRFYPSWSQLQFCSYTQIHLGPLRAALLEYGQKYLAASFRLISFPICHNSSLRHLRYSPLRRQEVAHPCVFPLYFVTTTDVTTVFTTIFHLASSSHQTFSDNMTPLVTAYLGDSVLLSPRSRRFVWSMTLMWYFLCHCNTSHKFRSSMCCCRARNQCFIL